MVESKFIGNIWDVYFHRGTLVAGEGSEATGRAFSGNDRLRQQSDRAGPDTAPLTSSGSRYVSPLGPCSPAKGAGGKTVASGGLEVLRPLEEAVGVPLPLDFAQTVAVLLPRLAGALRVVLFEVV